MSSETLDRSLVLDAVRVTEAAAIAAWGLVGRGDEKAADQAAVDAMRNALNELAIDGEIVIGEGERDEAPMLYIGEKVGTGKGPGIDIALDPLEGTTLTAKAMANALAVMAWAPRAPCSTRPTPTWTRSPAGRAIRKASSTWTRLRPRTPRPWPSPRAWMFPPSPSACWIVRATPRSSPACVRWARASI